MVEQAIADGIKSFVIATIDDQIIFYYELMPSQEGVVPSIHMVTWNRLCESRPDGIPFIVD